MDAIKVTLVMRDKSIWHVEVYDRIKYKEILDGSLEFLPCVHEGKSVLINKAMILCIRENETYIV